jgi:SAM-dependent methyltransferase
MDAATTGPVDSWDEAEQYEQYMGRWSRLAAAAFLRWLGLPAGEQWLEVGCGTGALTATIVAEAAAASLLAMDSSRRFLSRARQAVPGARFAAATVERLPLADQQVDAILSGLALNFFPDQQAALRELRRVVRPGGTIAAYMWDYAQGMGMLRTFWDAATALDPAARELDEGRRFPQQDGALATLFAVSGLRAVATAALEVEQHYSDFDDYWQPFLDGPGPAPGYVNRLAPARQAALAEALRAALPRAADGSITLTARAWGVRGTR